MRKIVIALGLLTAVFLTACAPSNKDADGAVLVVKAYAKALEEAYQNDNADFLSPFATPKQVSDIKLNILSYRTAGRHYNARLDNLTIKSTAKSKAKDGEDEVLVRTQEEWKFWVTELGKNTIVMPAKSATYDITYHLHKSGNSWVVRDMDVKG